VCAVEEFLEAVEHFVDFGLGVEGGIALREAGGALDEGRWGGEHGLKAADDIPRRQVCGVEARPQSSDGRRENDLFQGDGQLEGGFPGEEHGDGGAVVAVHDGQVALASDQAKIERIVFKSHGIAGEALLEGPLDAVGVDERADAQAAEQ